MGEECENVLALVGLLNRAPSCYTGEAGREALPEFVVLRGVFKPYGAQLFY